MGKGEEKPGFMGSKWMTIILIVVLIILAIVLIWVLKDPRGFERFKQKKKAAPPLKPIVHQQLHNPTNRLKLESIDSKLRVMAKLSWQESASIPQT